MTTQKTSDFYWACRNGDVHAVNKILPKLKLNDINRVESNGSTALHAASYYGHANIVHPILQRGATITIHNKYKKTAKEEASTDEVRATFESTVKAEEADDDDDDDDMPQSEFVQLYPNPKGMNKSDLATRILKARLSTYNANKYTISAASNLEHLEKKYRKLCEEKGDENVLRRGENFFNEYRKTGDFKHMLHLYTIDSPFYTMIEHDVTFLVEMYKHLLGYKQLHFRGRTYHCCNLLHKDFEPYQWAFDHSGCLIEIRKVMCTTAKRQSVVDGIMRFSGAGRPTILETDFAEECFTAIDLKPFNEYEAEEDVLLLSGTFFEVTQIREIREHDKDYTIISLKNIPADKRVLSIVT